MGNTYAWYYNAGNRIYYWTESFNMSASQFASEVSVRVDKRLAASDISASTSKELEAVKKRASQLIYIR